MTDLEVAGIVAEVERAVLAGEGTVRYPQRGRPSLTGRPAKSPTVGFRVTPELRSRAEVAAARKGISVSELARKALEDYLRKAG